MAAGIAEREGLITLDEYIYPWFEKYFPSTLLKICTR